MVRQTRGKTKPNRHSPGWLGLQSNTTSLNPSVTVPPQTWAMGKSHTASSNPRGITGFASPPSIIGVESAHHRHRQALAERHPEISFILDETVEFSRYRPPPKLIRALNVLRQYPPHEVASIRRGWLATSPGDVLLTEGTTDRDGDTSPCGARVTMHHRRWSSESGRRGLPPIQGGASQ